MVVAEVSITPLTDQLTAPVMKAVEALKQSGLSCEVGPMGTTIEGELDEVFEAIKRAHIAVRESGARHVTTQVRLDDKRGGTSIADKLEGLREPAIV